MGGLAIVVALSSHRRNIPVSLLAPSERRTLPSLQLPLLSGGTWQSREHRGRVIAINLWATWCAPCRQEMPFLSALAQQKRAAGLDVLGVTMESGDRREIVTSYLDRFPVAYPVSVAAERAQIGTPVEALPTTVLIDRQGRVAQTLVGAFTETQLRSAIEQLLAEDEAATQSGTGRLSTP